MKRGGLLLVIIALTVLNMNAQTTYKADVAATQITWNGKKVTGEHSGTVNLKEGWIKSDGKSLSGGEFVIDMSSIRDTDISDEKTRASLEGHLKSDDFFGVEKHPEAKLVLTGNAVFEGGKAKVKGNLTIKGITHPIDFVASESRNGDVITYTAVITVDRTLYDVRYGSGKFFASLGDKVIYDEFTLNVKLVVR